MSVRTLGQDVSVRPRTTPASTSVHGPWQITATGLPASKKAATNRTASSRVRSWSGFATPPGSTRPSKEAGSALCSGSSTGNVWPLSRWLKACTSPGSGATSTGVPPACSTACQGSVSSACSAPSLLTRNATRRPVSCPAMVSPARWVGCWLLVAFHAGGGLKRPATAGCPAGLPRPVGGGHRRREGFLPGQVAVHGGGGGPTLGQRPHDQRLPATHVAGHEDSRDVG